jgi:DNA-binding NtrC family response regulator
MNDRVVDTFIVGQSFAIRELRALIAKVAPARLPVLIQGPTGSGKELVARALHGVSGRRGAFVAFNVSAIAETLFEDALFGHVRGAFSGAVADSPGYLVEADHGTAFFDEIGALPLVLQAKLLRAVEAREFRPVGARRDRSSDFRIVTATNEPLAALVRRGAFRADLAHRLSGVVLEVPPLAARREDIPLLVRHFVAQERPICASTIDFTDEVMDRLCAYSWPGNVRELRHAVDRLIALAPTSLIGLPELTAILSSSVVTQHRPADLRSEERRQLLALLDAAQWDTKDVAARLGVDRVTVYRRMRRLGIATPLSRSRTAVDTRTV